MLGFLLRKGDEKEAAELKWRVRGKIDVRGEDRDRKAQIVWSVTAVSAFLVS